MGGEHSKLRAKAFKTVVVNHEDAAALTVLAGVLRNGFLHGAVRETGGAYGGGASHDATNAIFAFIVIAIPLNGNLADFDASIGGCSMAPPPKLNYKNRSLV